MKFPNIANVTATIVVTIFLCAVAGTAHAYQAAINGRATVIDGDTLEIRGQRIRLFGVDAPEGLQRCRDAACQQYRCGQLAANALSQRIGNGNVSCRTVDIDPYGRMVSVCRLDTLDLNGWLVEQGHAMAYRHFSSDYVSQEVVARREHRGIWSGSFARPWDWRRETRHGEAEPRETTGAVTRCSR